MSEFAQTLDRLKEELLTQAGRVHDLVTRAVESFFDQDRPKAKQVVDDDRPIDKVDVEIERASIRLLGMGPTDDRDIRSVLTIVKVNNELERIADVGVNIAEVVLNADGIDRAIPATFRVMANSVIGMLRDTNRALRDNNVRIAEQVLDFDDTVDRFKREISLDAQKRVAEGDYAVEFAFRMMAVTKAVERIADHCTNICEQVIYLETGQIVRHLPGGWTDPAKPEEI